MSDIVLSVDTANSGSTTNETFVVTDPSGGRSSYILDGTDLGDREELVLFGTRPKRAGNFRGVIRSGVKFTKAVSVPGVDATDSIDSDIILNLSASVPVGASETDLVHLRQRLVAILDDDAIMEKVMELAITQPTA